MAKKAAQLIDVALKANVAKSTVAAALRPGGGGKNARVGKATAERIRRIARELGYRPNSLASGLRGASTSSIAAVWMFIDPWCLDANVGNELLGRFQDDGLATYQAEHPRTGEELVSVLDDLLNRRPDALVIRMRPDLMDNADVRQTLTHFQAVVAVVPWAMPNVEFDQVVHDRTSGIREAVEHFARSGRTRPAIMLNLLDISDRQKHRVFREHCRAMGIAEHPHELIDLQDGSSSCEGRIERYADALDRHLAQGADTDAILVVNDLGLMAVAKCFRDRSIRVGQDVALIGLNDPPQMALWEPPLSCIDRNQSELLKKVHDLATRRMAQPDLPAQLQTVSMHMVWRESAGGSPAGDSRQA